MGETYNKMLNDLMDRYEKAWTEAIEEFDRNGTISDETDEMLKSMENVLAMMGAI